MMAIVLLSANLQPQKMVVVLATRRFGNENGRLSVNVSPAGSTPSLGGVSQYNGVKD